MFDLNPLDVLQQRKVQFSAPHFSMLKISEGELFEGVEDWVRTKLKGRYCIIKKPAIDKSGSLRSSHFIGFEDQKELTYFMLACPMLRRN